MSNTITKELLVHAFVNRSPTARGAIIRLLDGDMEKADALAKEYGLQNFGDYRLKGNAPTSSAKIDPPEDKKIDPPEDKKDDDGPKGTNPWVADTVDAQGRPDWSIAARRRQSEVVRALGKEAAARLAANANSFLGAPRPGAVRLTPRIGGDDRVTARVMGG